MHGRLLRRPLTYTSRCWWSYRDAQSTRFGHEQLSCYALASVDIKQEREPQSTIAMSGHASCTHGGWGHNDHSDRAQETYAALRLRTYDCIDTIIHRSERSASTLNETRLCWSGNRERNLNCGHGYATSKDPTLVILYPPTQNMSYYMLPAASPQRRNDSNRSQSGQVWLTTMEGEN